MTRQENPNFVASKYAPNPKEVSYWIDLSSDTTGNVIKSFDGKQWIPTNYKENTDQSERIDELDASLASEISRAKSKEQQLENTINTIDNTHSTDIQEVRESINELDSSKADKATTYTKSEVDTKLNAKANSADVYTKSQTDTAISNATNNKVTSTSVNSIQIVDAIPEADSQVTGVLYIKLSTAA